MESKLKLSRTKGGKSKIVDNNGFSMATAPDATAHSTLYMERLLLCYNILGQFDINYLRQMTRINFVDFTKHSDDI